ncbi:hypothetical protein B0H34DRAFT_856173 [Crassisporium funariophilum]|nr:hypothetical protein B0H34DRAFT_856173 [Crassisporium funariophilum]
MFSKSFLAIFSVFGLIAMVSAYPIASDPSSSIMERDVSDTSFLALRSAENYLNRRILGFGKSKDKVDKTYTKAEQEKNLQKLGHKEAKAGNKEYHAGDSGLRKEAKASKATLTIKTFRCESCSSTEQSIYHKLAVQKVQKDWSSKGNERLLAFTEVDLVLAAKVAGARMRTLSASYVNPSNHAKTHATFTIYDDDVKRA